MTLEDRQQTEIDQLRREKDGRREALVTAVSPLEISIGGSDTSVRAVAADGVELQVNDRVTVSVQDMAIPFVMGRPTDDPSGAAGGVPAAHASSHGSAGSDPVTLSQSQVTGLVSDLAGKEPSSRVRVNLVPNPSAETNVTGWTLEGAGSRSRVTTEGYYGACCFEINSTATLASGMYTAALVVSPGLTYTGSAYVKARDANDVGKVIRLDLLEYNGGGSLLATTTGTLALTADWARVSVSKVVGGSTASVRLAFRNNASVAADYFADAVLLEQGSLGSYFDGSTTGASWSGTAHGSSSSLTTVVVRSNDDVLTEKAPLVSPTFTGDPKAPTPSTSDNDTSIATTAHVKAQPLNAFAAPTADIPMSTQKFTGMAQGSASGHSVEYDQMIAGDVAAQMGFTMKPAVYAASIAALPAHSRSGDVLTASGNGFLAPSFGTLKFSWASGSAGTGNGQFDESFDVAIDSSGNIFVIDHGNNRVQKFNGSGVYQSQFSTSGPCVGIAIDGSDNTWVAFDGTDGFAKYNSAGVLQATYSTNNSGLCTGGIAIDSSGNVYIPVIEFAGVGNYRIQKFNSSGTYQSQFGSTGTGNGQFNTPQAIACDSSNNVYVADSGNHRVQKFNSSGTYQSKFGTVGKEDGQFLAPNGIEIDSGGNIWVADHFNNRVQKFNSSGTFQAKYGSLGSGNGQMLGPRGIVVTAGGDLIVADSYNNRVQRFTAFTLSAGQFVLVRHEGGGTHIENNIYEITNPGGASAQWVLTLRPDAATGFLKAQNMVIAQVENATQNRVFTLTTSDPITVWTTPLTWERFEPGGPPSPHASNHSPGSSDPIPELEDLMPLLDEEPWIEIGSGGSAPAFTNSWVNYGGATQTAAFYKDPLGIVRLKGLIKSGTIASPAFTLPAGYRPSAESTFVIMANSAIARLIVAANGNVTVQTGSNVWASLDGITFRAA